jgi:hypothetical protein
MEIASGLSCSGDYREGQPLRIVRSFQNKRWESAALWGRRREFNVAGQ